MVYWGAAQSINVTRFADQEGIISPRTIIDIFKSISPRIAMVNRVIHRNFRAVPQFLLTGMRTGAMLESMQQWTTSMTNYSSGEAGYISNQSSSLIKQTVLTSPAISDNKIYTIYKAPGDNLSRACIIDFIYKPLYIIEEITNSVKRTFVKSRTALEICATHATGVIHVEGLDDFLGPELLLP
jgi:hypothetical protein